MKKTFLLVLLCVAVLPLSGCYGWLTGQMNTKTVTKYPNGVIETKYELTNDGYYYERAASAKQHVDCSKYSFEQCVAITAVSALADRGFVPRGMSGYELISKVSGDAVSIAPMVGWGFTAYQAFKRPGSVTMNGDGATYAPFENHVTGSDGATVSVPYRWQTSESTDFVPTVE